MRLKTGNDRKRRKRIKASGHVYIRFNHGNWTWPGLIGDTPEGFEGMIVHVPYDREQPNAYRYYPR